MILVDTSVWIRHLQENNERLVELLETTQVKTHPFVIGELACGLTSRRRGEMIYYLQLLPRTPVATEDEALAFIEQRRIMGRGVGYVDAHLLAGAALAGTDALWTHDRRLADVAEEMGLGFGVF